MEFKIVVSNGNEEWEESYSENVEDPHKWAKDTIKFFNSTLKPGEKPRTLVSVIISDNSNKKHHKWIKRTDGMSKSFRGSIVDFMYCDCCGITGKRYGTNGRIKIDSKYRKNAFRECHTAIEEMKKRATWM